MTEFEPDSRERDRALELIGRIYDGALRPEAWPDVVGETVAFVGGTKGLLFTSLTLPKDGGFTFPYRVSPSFLQQWHDEYMEGDLWWKTAVQKGLYVGGTTALGTDFVTEEELRESRAYRELLRHEGIGQLCTGIVFGPESAGIPPTLCSVFRALTDPRFSEIERDRMQVLVPHLSRALGVMFRLRDAELKIAATLAALDRLTSGVLLLDSRGQANFVNRTARRALEQSDGLRLRTLRRGEASGRLLAEDAAAQRAIEQAVADCLRPNALHIPHFSRSVSVPRPSRRRDYVLQLAPLPQANHFRPDGAAASAIVFVTDPEEPLALDEALLRRLYGLTAAESRLAQLLCSGETLASAAERCGVSTETTRTQLKRIFKKTGVARQAELVRLLLALGSERT